VELGFETIGNATLVVHDDEPVLATDPWLDGPAYFGSWSLSHEVPEPQRRHVERAPNLWISHAHPDHLSMPSLARLRGRRLLLADHVGGRMARELCAAGFDVLVLPDRQWVPLSPRVRVLSLADYNQDSILLVAAGDCLVVNVNDAGELGWGRLVRREITRHRVAFLLQLFEYGDADMIQLSDERGPILPYAARREPVGERISQACARLGARYAVPFSSMHRYQRADSVWANQYTMAPEDFARGFRSRTASLLPPFIRYDCLRDEVSRIDPPARTPDILPSETFGDTWADPLDADEARRVRAYVGAIEHLRGHFDVIAFRVGGVEHAIDVGRGTRRGLTFEAPRHSLMKAIDARTFDDLLIGNFVRTTVHGPRTARSPLYPNFTPYVTKYADNGDARTRDELHAYFAAYRRRAPLEYFRHAVQAWAVDTARARLAPESRLHRAARGVYRAARRRRVTACR